MSAVIRYILAGFLHFIPGIGNSEPVSGIGKYIQVIDIISDGDCLLRFDGQVSLDHLK